MAFYVENTAPLALPSSAVCQLSLTSSRVEKSDKLYFRNLKGKLLNKIARILQGLFPATKNEYHRNNFILPSDFDCFGW